MRVGNVKEIVFSKDPKQMNWLREDFPYAEVKCPPEFSAEVQNEKDGDVLTTKIVVSYNGAHPYFTNAGSIGVSFPLQDRYTDSVTCRDYRCHAHIFCGENTSYIMALRMGGAAPHLGMVLTKGSLSAYSIERDLKLQSNFSTLCRGHIIPKELDKETAAKFMEAAEQFERIINDSGFVRLRRLSTDEIVGTDGKAGLIERYFSLMPEGDATLQDIDLSAREMRIGDNRLCLHTLSDAEDLPGTVATDTRYEKLSTDRSDCRLSFASPVGLLLSCNHIYNQYVIIDNSEENLQKFEKSARNMQSLSRYSRSNSINREWVRYVAV